MGDDRRHDIPEKSTFVGTALSRQTAISASRRPGLSLRGSGSRQKAVRTLPHRVDLGGNQVGTLAHHAENPVTAGLGHGGGKFRTGDAAQPRQHDRHAATEKFAERGVQSMTRRC